MEPHNMEFIKTLLIACIPALISGAISFLVAKSQASNAIEQSRTC